MKKVYAVISDIHGNALALNAVLDDIASKNIDQIINLGDCFYGPLMPAKTAEILLKTPMLTISGNKDRNVLESLDALSDDNIMEFVKSNLSVESINFLKNLPGTLIIDDLIFACHGTPESDNDYLTENITKEGVFVYHDDVLTEKLKNINQKIVLCGHSHVSRMIYLSNGKIVINPGSVGLPAYLANAKHRFVMESMSPHAKYAIIKINDDDIQVEQVNCTYNWHQASALAKQNGKADWAEWLLKGKMPKDMKI